MLGLGALAVVLVAIVGLLLYGRSKVKADGSLVLEGSAVVNAPIERGFARILSADGLKAWWLTSLGNVDASPKWPEPGETMKFQMNGQTVTYTAVTIDRPRRLVARAEYPDAVSTVTQEFALDGEKRVVYRKTVEARLRPGTGTLKTWMLGAIIGLSVPAEVKRAAAYASRE
jgi:uncharacterized protein YndB with AHSA1/START domain